MTFGSPLTKTGDFSMFVPWLTLFDFANVRANFKTPIDFKTIHKRSDDFALLVPIFNDLKYLTNVEFLSQYSKHVILCTTTAETPEFVSALEALSAKHGFRISYSEIEGTTKNPWMLYHKTLLAHDSVLKRTILDITEKYVIFIDGDTYVDGDLEVLCGAMDTYSFDIASVKILPARRKNIIENLQGVEYDIAMRARLLYPWLTSGAGMVARKDVMNAVMANHSLFFNGGDIEIGKLSDMMGYKVGHLPMVFYTDVPDTFNKWVNQRRSWMCGMFRHSVVNIELNLWHPFHFIYYSVVIYFLYPIKILEIITHIHLLPLVMLLYMGATFLANWKVRSKWMLIYPAYALFQVIVLIWLGLARYASTYIKTGNVGKINIKFNPNRRTVAGEIERGGTLVKNYALILAVVVVIALGAFDTLQHIIFGQPYQLFGFTEVIENMYLNFVNRATTFVSTMPRDMFWLLAIFIPLTIGLALMMRIGVSLASPQPRVEARQVVARKRVRRDISI
jgi:hypothetical protein